MISSPANRIEFSSWLLFLISAQLAGAQDLLEPLVVAERKATAGDEASLATLVGGGDLRQLLSVQPNLSTGDSPGTLFSLRGIAQEGTLVVGNRTNPGLTVRVGSFPRSTNSLWAVGAPGWDCNGPFVEPGPGLFGLEPASQGGVISLQPNAPQFVNGGKWLGEIGTNTSYRSGATLNSVLIPDHLAMRLNLYAEGNDGGITNVASDNDRFASTDRQMARGQLRWNPAGDDTARVDLLAETTRVQGNPLAMAGMRPNFDLFDRRVNLNQSERVPADHHGISLNLETALDPAHQLEATLAWQEADGYQLADLDSSPVLDWRFRVDVEEQRLSGGAKLRREGVGQQMIFGAYGDSAEYRLRFHGRGFFPTVDGVPFSTRVSETVNMAAVFARYESELYPAVWGFGGLRLDRQERSVSIRASRNNSPEKRDEDDATSTAWLPELGVEWRRENAKVGIKAARSYRPSGVSYGLSVGETLPYDPEEGWEIQGYGDWKRDALRIAPRIFFANADSLQVVSVFPGGVSALDPWLINAGSAVRYGAELEVGWTGPGFLRADVHGGWLATEMKDVEINGIRRSGDSLPNAPEWNAGLAVRWSPPQGWFGESLLAWQDETYAQFISPQVTRLESRLELSARIGYRWQDMEIYLFGQNLLDRDFTLASRDFTGNGSRVEGSPNLPRTLGVGMIFDW
jgi:outer membrane receptor protein involved in Fe transport